jgi:hypothetical protein
MSILPEDDKARKNTPIFRMITRYFPKALREVTKVCVANNVRYSPDREPADITWARGKSPDQLGSLFRHILERTVDDKMFELTTDEVAEATGITRVYVLAEASWRALAALELEIEAYEQVCSDDLTKATLAEVATPAAESPTRAIMYENPRRCACGKTLVFEDVPEYIDWSGVSHMETICTPGGTRCPQCQKRSPVEAKAFGAAYCRACRFTFVVGPEKPA